MAAADCACPRRVPLLGAASTTEATKLDHRCSGVVSSWVHPPLGRPTLDDNSNHIGVASPALRDAPKILWAFWLPPSAGDSGDWVRKLLLGGNATWKAKEESPPPLQTPRGRRTHCLGGRGWREGEEGGTLLRGKRGD